jgi:hypothetical protein
MVVLRSSSRFSVVTSICPIVSPVRLPPGRARLATPTRRGSEKPIMTMGMVELAAIAARIASGPGARITLTPECARSFACAGS